MRAVALCGADRPSSPKRLFHGPQMDSEEPLSARLDTEAPTRTSFWMMRIIFFVLIS
jgi:hypothetical protein